jgi:ABC-2 type transport system permease protein
MSERTVPTPTDPSDSLPPDDAVWSEFDGMDGVSADEAGPKPPSELLNLISGQHKPVPANAFSASMSFTWRALLKIKHVPEQLFDVTIFPIMFTLLFTYLFGGALAGSPSAYLQFLLPGILVQTVLMITIYTGMTLSQDITKGVFDRFRSLPIWAPAVLVGALLADAIRYAVASAMCLLLGLILGFRPPGGVAGVVPAVLLILVFCFGLSWIWTLLGLLLRSPTAVQGWSMMFLFPLTFASNIFVEPTTMPSWLEAFVDVNPVSVLTTAVRGLMAGETDGSAILTVLLISAALTIVFAPLTMRLYRTRN